MFVPNLTPRDFDRIARIFAGEGNVAGVTPRTWMQFATVVRAGRGS